MHDRFSREIVRPMTRRQMLTRGGSLLAGSALGASLLAQPAHAIDWSAVRKLMEGTGFGIVASLSGKATADGRPLEVGSRIASGAQIEVGPAGRLIMKMSDRSVFQFTGPASLNLILSMMREGILNLLLGALLAVVPRDNHYLVAGPTGTVGIKGTVFFREVYGREETTVQGMDASFVTPKGVKEYSCNCNGEIEYLKNDAALPFMSDRAEHHNSYYLNPAMPGRLMKAPMVNHTDEQIKALIALQDGEKHDASWIERYEQSRR